MESEPGGFNTLDFDFLVASGSLPPAGPLDFYPMVAKLVRNKGAKLVLDTSGPALQRALDRGVFMIKPNLGEFESLVRTSASDVSVQEREVQGLIRSGRWRSSLSRWAGAERCWPPKTCW